MEQQDIMHVDVAEILKKKAPDKARFVPGFVTSWLARIIHQDEINTALARFGKCESVDFADNIVRHTLEATYTPHGIDRLDTSKRYVFVSNHPLGGLDGMVLIACIGKRFKEVRFVVNDLLMFLKPLAPIFVPVNKFGRTGNESARAINEAFAGDAQILYFPAGLCSRKQKDGICDLPWKSTFLKKAKEYGRDIVPVFFNGRNSAFFYRLAKLRKALGIKFNIEMMFLPDEMFRQRGNSFELYFGEPIPISSIDSSKSMNEWVETIRNATYKLKPAK
ncbi:MAG: 1-acyl-sn-glycerol-3-phosphate acyltransferase [Muribaculum sp.]|uniref:1-acyl-sn-glycerol-3-phosphate acyltransferase n=1 Tax=Candidatus Merdivivens faecigallinarum TaxID=2840871 RepID=A0A9D9IZN9_9BACT|nr:1-acyl-sn-glycerol-3-phosphate acyltransferase [Candidatus Merdivivens faecigallinarum]